jgi:hypothetical protein
MPPAERGAAAEEKRGEKTAFFRCNIFCPAIYSQPIADLLVDFKIYRNIEDRKEKNYSSSTINASYADGILVLDREVTSDRSYGGSLEVSTALADHEILQAAFT